MIANKWHPLVCKSFLHNVNVWNDMVEVNLVLGLVYCLVIFSLY
jgi:hypothetical protein